MRVRWEVSLGQTVLPLVVHWMGPGDERSDGELVDQRGSLDRHRDADAQRARYCKRAGQDVHGGGGRERGNTWRPFQEVTLALVKSFITILLTHYVSICLVKTISSMQSAVAFWGGLGTMVW